MNFAKERLKVRAGRCVSVYIVDMLYLHGEGDKERNENEQLIIICRGHLQSQTSERKNKNAPNSCLGAVLISIRGASAHKDTKWKTQGSALFRFQRMLEEECCGNEGVVLVPNILRLLKNRDRDCVITRT